LIRLAKDPSNMQYVEDACRRAGIKPGDRIIDVGCGPLGALLTLSSVVGAAGMVVGMDRESDVLGLAQQILRQEGADNVKLLRADINHLSESAEYPLGSFDAAYCRLVLVNQKDPVTALRGVASLVRPGGHVIIHEVLDDPAFPMFDPPVPAFQRFLQLLWESLRLAGKRPDIARQFRSIAREADLKEVSQRGLFNATPADAGDFVQEQGLGMLLAFKPSLLKSGLATRDEIDELVRELKQATSVQYRSFFSWILLELIAQVPES
jgi:ubiquinone/menaquinone biosynthesis C-methylase UbiE